MLGCLIAVNIGHIVLSPARHETGMRSAWPSTFGHPNLKLRLPLPSLCMPLSLTHMIEIIEGQYY